MSTNVYKSLQKEGQSNRCQDMPGAKYIIERKCKLCGALFHARQIDSLFCSRRCSKKFSKQKKKEEERQKQLTEIEGNVSDNRNFLTVKEATAVFAVCRDTLYRLIRRNQIPHINLNKHLIRISRSELEIRFTKRYIALSNQDKSLPKLYSLEPEDCFTVGEITERFGISEKTVYEMIRRHAIPMRQIGKFVYIPKVEINNIINKC